MGRFVMSILLVLAWLGFVVQGTHALFSDQVSLTGNIITTGGTDLQISNSQNGSSTLFADSRSGFSFDLSPGEWEDKYFFLKNVGSSDIALDIDVNCNSTGDSDAMLGSLSVEFTPVDSEGNPQGSKIATTLREMLSRHINLGVSVAEGKSQRFLLRVGLSANYFRQNDSAAYDLYFTGTQHLAV